MTRARPVRAHGRVIGYLTGRTFLKRVIGSKHRLRKPPSWCISKQAFIEEIMPNTDSVEIWDTESETLWEVATQTFAEHAFEIERGGFEPQLVLGLEHWHTEGNSTESHKKVTEKVTNQFSFWGEGTP